jgi:hypothetical protein
VFSDLRLAIHAMRSLAMRDRSVWRSMSVCRVGVAPINSLAPLRVFAGGIFEASKSAAICAIKVPVDATPGKISFDRRAFARIGLNLLKKRRAIRGGQLGH